MQRWKIFKEEQSTDVKKSWVNWKCIITLLDKFQFPLLLLYFVGISIGIASSTIGLKICSTTAGMKKYESKQLRKKEGTW